GRLEVDAYGRRGQQAQPAEATPGGPLVRHAGVTDEEGMLRPGLDLPPVRKQDVPHGFGLPQEFDMNDHGPLLSPAFRGTGRGPPRAGQTLTPTVAVGGPLTPAPE